MRYLAASFILGFFRRNHKGKNFFARPPPSLRKQRTIHNTTCQMTCEERAQKFHTDDVWVVLLIGRATREVCFNQSSTTQILVVTRHQYGISAVVPKMSWETSGDVSCFLRLPAPYPWELILMKDYRRIPIITGPPKITATRK